MFYKMSIVPGYLYCTLHFETLSAGLQDIFNFLKIQLSCVFYYMSIIFNVPLFYTVEKP
jgi:hypothetical protein